MYSPLVACGFLVLMSRHEGAISHTLPPKFTGHAQLNFSFKSVQSSEHVPPYKQGFDRQHPFRQLLASCVNYKNMFQCAACASLCQRENIRGYSTELRMYSTREVFKVEFKKNRLHFNRIFRMYCICCISRHATVNAPECSGT